MDDPGIYRRLVGKFNYLTITSPNIAFAVSVVSQFLLPPKTSHWNAALRVLRYLKKAYRKRLLYSDYGHTPVAELFNDN